MVCTPRALCDHRSCAATSCAAPRRRCHNPPAVCSGFHRRWDTILRNCRRRLMHQPCKSRATYCSSWLLPADNFRCYLRIPPAIPRTIVLPNGSNYRFSSHCICSVATISTLRRSSLRSSPIFLQIFNIFRLHHPWSSFPSSPPFGVSIPSLASSTHSKFCEPATIRSTSVSFWTPQLLKTSISFWPPRSETTVMLTLRPDCYRARSGALPRNTHENNNVTQHETFTDNSQDQPGKEITQKLYTIMYNDMGPVPPFLPQTPCTQSRVPHTPSSTV